MRENEKRLLATDRYKDGIELRSGGKYRIVEDDDKVQLIVRGVDKEDAGDITCELSNSKGKEAATAKLGVQSRHSHNRRRCHSVHCKGSITPDPARHGTAGHGTVRHHASPLSQQVRRAVRRHKAALHDTDADSPDTPASLRPTRAISSRGCRCRMSWNAAYSLRHVVLCRAGSGVKKNLNATLEYFGRPVILLMCAQCELDFKLIAERLVLDEYHF